MFYIPSGLQSFVITETTPFGLGLNETIIPQYLKPLGYNTHLVGKYKCFFGHSVTVLLKYFSLKTTFWSK